MGTLNFIRLSNFVHAQGVYYGQYGILPVYKLDAKEFIKQLHLTFLC